MTVICKAAAPLPSQHIPRNAGQPVASVLTLNPHASRVSLQPEAGRAPAFRLKVKIGIAAALQCIRSEARLVMESTCPAEATVTIQVISAAGRRCPFLTVVQQ